MVQSTGQVLGHTSAKNAHENTLVVWTSEWKVEMMGNRCTRSEVFFSKTHGQMAVVLEYEAHQWILKARALKKKGVKTYLVHTSRQRTKTSYPASEKFPSALLYGLFQRKKLAHCAEIK